MKMKIALISLMGFFGSAYAEPLDNQIKPSSAGCTPYISGNFGLSLYPDHGTDQTTSVRLDKSQTFQIIVGDFNDKTQAFINLSDDVSEGKWIPIKKNNSYLLSAKTISIRGVRGSPPPYEDTVSGRINVCVLQ